MRKKTIKFAQWAQINTAYLPLYIAMETGIFGEYSIDVEINQVGNDDEIFNAVASGEADFGVGDPVFCAMQKNKHFNAKVIATIANRAGIFGFTHNPVIPEIKSKADLVNLRVGSFPAPSTVYALITEVKNQNKRLLKSMQIIEAPIGEQIDLLGDGRADIALDVEPFVSLAESKGYRVVHSFPNFHGPYTMTGMYVLQRTIDQDPERVTQVANAIQKALNIIHTDQDAVLQVSKKLFPQLKDSVHRRSIDRLKNQNIWPETIRVERKPWKAAIKTRKNTGDQFVGDVFDCVLDLQ